MTTITTKDGTQIFYKDWGAGQPLVFHHGWPLSADDWDTQMMYFLAQGFRVIAHDRRGHGRSDQTANGNEMDTYAADMAELVQALDLRDAIHIGHSTGGGEVTRYVARHGKGRVAKAMLISAVPPIMVKSSGNPGGTPIEVFDGYRAQLAANRADLYWNVPIPFYGFNRDGAKRNEAVRANWWRQGMMGGAKPHYDCIKAFSETDFTGDLKAIDVPVLVMHGDDDQIVPFADSAPLSAKLLKKGTLKVYKGFPNMACARPMPRGSTRTYLPSSKPSRASPYRFICKKGPPRLLSLEKGMRFERLGAGLCLHRTHGTTGSLSSMLIPCCLSDQVQNFAIRDKPAQKKRAPDGPLVGGREEARRN